MACGAAVGRSAMDRSEVIMRFDKEYPYNLLDHILQGKYCSSELNKDETIEEIESIILGLPAGLAESIQSQPVYSKIS